MPAKMNHNFINMEAQKLQVGSKYKFEFILGGYCNLYAKVASLDEEKAIITWGIGNQHLIYFDETTVLSISPLPADAPHRGWRSRPDSW